MLLLLQFGDEQDMSFSVFHNNEDGHDAYREIVGKLRKIEAADKDVRIMNDAPEFSGACCYSTDNGRHYVLRYELNDDSDPANTISEKTLKILSGEKLCVSVTMWDEDDYSVKYSGDLREPIYQYGMGNECQMAYKSCEMPYRWLNDDVYILDDHGDFVFFAAFAERNDDPVKFYEEWLNEYQK